MTTDFVGRTDSLARHRQLSTFMEAVFGDAEKSPPDEAQLPQGFAVYQVLAVKPAATPTFEEIRSRVETEFKNERVERCCCAKNAGTFRSRQSCSRFEESCQGTRRDGQDQRLVLPDGQVPDIGSMTGPRPSPSP